MLAGSRWPVPARLPGADGVDGDGVPVCSSRAEESVVSANILQISEIHIIKRSLVRMGTNVLTRT